MRPCCYRMNGFTMVAVFDVQLCAPYSVMRTSAVLYSLGDAYTCQQQKQTLMRYVVVNLPLAHIS